jgi:methylated-DNA-[protein]-cysteine S-methyltransferase
MTTVRQLVTTAMASGDSRLGGLAVAVVGGSVCGVAFGHANMGVAAAALSRRLSGYVVEFEGVEPDDDQALAEETLQRLQKFAAGELVELDRIPVSLSHLTPFQRRVVDVCRKIRRGQSLSYGQVAAAAGSPGAARAVGQVMRNNRVPLLVPCHRVVAAGGKIGGFSAPQGLAMKRRLLELESDQLFS